MSSSTPHTAPPALTRASIEAAHELIKSYLHRTPILTNTTLTNLASTPQTREALEGTPWDSQEPARPKIRLFFKCENFQRIGAFKVRGAFHAVLRLVEERGIEEVRRTGVVTHSSGVYPALYLYPFSLPWRAWHDATTADHVPGLHQLKNLNAINTMITRKPRPSSRSRCPHTANPRTHRHAQQIHTLQDRRHKVS
jgi:hypothetical protein